MIGAAVVLFAVLFVPIFVWYFCRIEVEPGEIAVLIKKTGEDLPSGQIMAQNADQKGIQPQVLSEGRYFYNPYSWDWEIHEITDIPAGKLGVITRRHGKALEGGRIVASDGERGIAERVLTPGKYRINPYAEIVEEFDAINVRPGHVGVVTSLVGKDVLSDGVPQQQRNTFLVAQGMKGVVPEVLDPGTYYLNPYLYSVTEVNLQSQRFEMSGSDAIEFLTVDGFNVRVEGTIEFSIRRDQAAFITHRVGDMDDVVKKVILPRARGFSRIEGSKQPAVNYIVGETRQKFEDNLREHLRENCELWGVTVHSVLVRSIIPPDEIARVIREREVAVQNARKYEQQIAQARSKAELARQEMLAQQNREKVEAETAQILAVINAERDQAVKLTAAQRELDVAQIERQAADFQAEAMLVQARAERDVIRLSNEAKASVASAQVRALGGGLFAARNAFLKKVGPRVFTVVADDSPQSFGALLQAFLNTTPGAAIPAKGGKND